MAQRVLVLAAGMFAGVGVLFAVRAAWPERAASRPASVAAVQAPTKPTPLFSDEVQPILETTVTAENAPLVAEEMSRRARVIVQATPELSGLGAEMTERLIATVREQAEIYLSGDLTKHEAFIARTGGRYNDPDSNSVYVPRHAQSDVGRKVWTLTAATIALKPVSVEKVRVVLRWLNGEPRPAPDDAHITIRSHSPGRWPSVSGEPGPNKLTVVEIRWPVFYFKPAIESSPMAAGPVTFGIFLAWDGIKKKWLIQELRIYNPLRINTSACPLF